jgi:hypothetical protein
MIRQFASFGNGWQTFVLARSPYATQYAQLVANTHYISSLEIETRGTLPDLERKVTAALLEIDPNLMGTEFHSYSQQINLEFSQ